MSRNWFNRARRNPPSAPPDGPASATLAGFPGGSQVCVTGFGDLAVQQMQHLQAYGVLPGRTIKILAQQPLTIILAEQTELALESSVAAQVFVQLIDIPV